LIKAIAHQALFKHKFILLEESNTNGLIGEVLGNSKRKNGNF
jgi:hypothetical protein